MGANLRSQRYTKFIVYGVAVVLVNIVGITLFFRIDLTAGNKYSLSPASRQAVADISEPLTIKVFFTRHLPAPHNTTERYLHDLLEAYAVQAGDNFNYRFYNVTPGGSEVSRSVSRNQQLAQDYGIHPVQVQNIESDEVKVKQAYMGMVIIHGDMTEKVSPIKSTDGLEYRITTGIRKLAGKISTFAGLKEAVKVRLYLSSSLNEVAPIMNIKNLADLPATVKEIVSKMNERLSGKLAFETVDPTKHPEAIADIKEGTLLQLEWPKIPRQGQLPVPAGEGAVGIIMSYKNRQTSLPLLNVVDVPIFGTQYSMPKPKEIEASLDASLESLVGINDEIGYLANHGTQKLRSMMMGQQQGGEDSMDKFQALVKDNYSLKSVKLGEEKLSGRFNCLIVARPTEPFTDYELYRIDQYLMQGNNLALFLDRYKKTYPRRQQSQFSRPRCQPIDTGLSRLLEHYGVTVEEAVVMDENCYERQGGRFSQGGGKQPVYFAPLIKNKNINNRPEFMQNIKGLVAMKVSPLSVDKETLTENGITAATLFSSSDRSWKKTGRISFNPMFIRPPGSDAKRQSYPLACLLKGEFPSYFADKPIPEKETKEAAEEQPKQQAAEQQAGQSGAAVKATGRTIQKGKPAKIFVTGSSQMLYDHMLDREGRFPNSVFVMNVLDTLNGRDNIAVLRSKQQAYNPIGDVSASVKAFIKWANIAGLPVLVILAGLLVWLMRVARKRRIRMMFAG